MVYDPKDKGRGRIGQGGARASSSGRGKGREAQNADRLTTTSPARRAGGDSGPDDKTRAGTFARAQRFEHGKMETQARLVRGNRGIRGLRPGDGSETMGLPIWAVSTKWAEENRDESDSDRA